ncbi:MAG: EF-Tu/IF-2/RF-3 family GTPase, partial [Desulfonatronovibrionaceae bacterium]
PDQQEAELLEKWRNSLLETLSEVDDQILEKYLENQEISPELLKSAIRTAALELRGVPVLCGSALKNMGIQPVLDAVCDYLPSPADVPQIKGIHPLTREPVSYPPEIRAPLSALAFKVSMETGRKLVLVRIYSGKLMPGQEVFNSTQNIRERAARIFILHANHKEKTDQALAGQIVALAGLKQTRTGDTLCLEEQPLLLEKISEYRPVISLALEPRNSQEEEKLIFAVERMLQEDPTLFFHRDQDTDQIIISGMGELHLDVVLHRIRREHSIDFRAGNPQVVYQETISRSSSAEYEFARELGETFHYGFVSLTLEPRPRGQGNRTVLETDPDQWPDKWLEAVHQGIEDGLQAGELKGYPLSDVKVRITGLGSREGADEAGFRLAAFHALKKAVADSGPLLLEPVMMVEITTPMEFVGECISLLGSKGGHVDNMYDRHDQKVIVSLAPMNKMFGFSTDLRSATQGRAGFTMKFHCFDVAGT